MNAVLAPLRALTTPAKVQDFLDTLAINHEKDGETCMSPLLVLRHQKAHCLEGALLAAAAFTLQGERALLLNLRSVLGDDDHTVALFQRNGYWGAVSKTNHSVLRFRDPVYRNLRELSLSYFHEYFLDADGKKTLREYSLPLNLSRFGSEWMHKEEDVWEIAYALRDMPHRPLIPPENFRHLRPADHMERRGSSFVEWPASDPRT